MGPAMRRVLLRLFLVLDANGSGALEYEARGDDPGTFNPCLAC